MNPLSLTLLNAHLESESERMQLVRRQNEGEPECELGQMARENNDWTTMHQKCSVESINHETRIQNRKNPHGMPVKLLEKFAASRNKLAMRVNASHYPHRGRHHGEVEPGRRPTPKPSPPIRT